MTDPRSIAALDVAERFANGDATAAELEEARNGARAARAATYAAASATYAAASAAATYAAYAAADAARTAEYERQKRLLIAYLLKEV
jgi:hypothetical protein